jgi:hypothetical protein
MAEHDRGYQSQARMIVIEAYLRAVVAHGNSWFTVPAVPKPPLLFSGSGGGRASRATLAQARACSVVRAGTKRILPSVFFQSDPTTEREESNPVFHFSAT